MAYLLSKIIINLLFFKPCLPVCFVIFWAIDYYFCAPHQYVFEDRNKRLGGSIRAQEVHLSINPVTYIQSEGDIFIGEGITVETFKGLVNEAFVNRAQDALETGELEIDSLVNVKG